MIHLKSSWFASCLVATMSLAASHALAAPYDDCRNGNAFIDSDKQFTVCDAALKVASDAKQKAFLQFKRGEARYWQDLLGPALADVNLAIEGDPDLVPAYVRRAWIYIFSRQWGEASRDLEEALARQPKNAEALYALSFMYGMGTKKGFEAARQAVESDPNFHLARLNLAKQYYFRGDLGAMLEEFATILSHGEAELNQVAFRGGDGRRDPYPFVAHVRYERARYLVAVKHNDEALADLDWLTSHYPKMALAYAMRGQIREKENDRLEAVKDYSRAIELDPDYAEARQARGWSLLRMARLDEAMADADWLTQSSRGEFQTSGHRLRGSIARERGDAEQALIDYEQAFRNDPRFRSSMQARLIELGYLAPNPGDVYTEEMRNGIRACLADPQC